MVHKIPHTDIRWGSHS